MGLLAYKNQAQKVTNITNEKHTPTLYSIYTILYDDDDDDNKEGGNEGATIHLDVDANTGDGDTQTNKAKSKKSQIKKKAKQRRPKDCSKRR